MNFVVTNASQSRKLLQEIQKRHAVRKQPVQSHRQTLFDTFDWRLFRNGLTLVVEQGETALLSLESNTAVATAPPPQKTARRFWWDWPDGDLQSRLRSMLGVRALLPLSDVKIDRETYNILNSDEKTVLRVLHEKIVVNPQSAPVRLHCFRLEPVRGYNRELHKFGDFLTKLGVQEAPVGAFEMMMKAAGKQPGDYSSKLEIRLSPQMTASEAARTILLDLLQTIRRNEDGLRADIDTEFLHDFRVAIRRSRSALTQIKGVFAQDIVERFTADFAKFAKRTNRLRDLDVFLLKEAEYKSRLPRALQKGLDGLFGKLVKARKREQKKIAAALQDPAYKQLIAAWSLFLDRSETPSPNEAPNALKPAPEIARKFIRKKYRKVLALGKAIMPTSPDDELHRLRIECKKLRYLLEFFASLFPENEINKLIKQLKKLQDNLGDFNDLFLQTEMLYHYLGTFNSKNPDVALTQPAIGALVADLHRKQVKERQAFAQTFAVFSSAENRKLFRKLCGEVEKN